MSSLNMNGISITLLRVDGPRRAEILEYIDLPVDTPNWPRVVNMEAQVDNLVALGRGDQSAVTNQDFSASDSEATKAFRAGVGKVLETIIANEDALTKMDGAVGDGDLGIGATRGSKAVLTCLKSFDFENDFHGSITRFSDLFSDGFGGTSGPLWGAFMSQGATKLKPKLAENGLDEWRNAFSEGLTAMKNIGEAKKGDRTMVDALEEGKQFFTEVTEQVKLKDLA